MAKKKRTTKKKTTKKPAGRVQNADTPPSRPNTRVTRAGTRELSTTVRNTNRTRGRNDTSGRGPKQQRPSVQTTDFEANTPLSQADIPRIIYCSLV